MLKELSIKNYALIEDIQISFGRGLNILTGETGAGKSIIIGALSLMLGERVNTGVVRKGASGCEVSGLFEIEGESELRDFLAENDIIGKGESEILFRRVLSREGKNKSYLNGQIVTQSILHRVGTYLVDIHGQHTHQLLYSLNEQMGMIDRFGNLEKHRAKVKSLFKGYSAKKAELESVMSLAKETEERLDLYRYQLKEIRDAKLKAGEEDELNTECNILNNSEKINLIAQDIYKKLFSSNESVKVNIENAEKGLEKLVAIDDSFKNNLDKITSFKYELDDIISAIDEYSRNVEYNPKRLEEVIQRLELIKKLKRKYGKSIDDILLVEKELKQKVAGLDNSPETLKKLKVEVEAAKAVLYEQAKSLSAKRKTVSKKLSQRIEKELKELAMEKTGFSVKLDRVEVKASGIDDMEFLIAPNVGEDMKPLAKIASSGETSRIMLAIKTVLANADRVPVLIFDEIDTGIGGGVAGVVGKKLKGLCSGHQVICVTHLPQIAGYADAHFHVGKSVSEGRTRTNISQLDSEERVNEIARMLAGASKTPIAKKHAREIIEQGVG